jgi:hypothetical protein
VVVDADQRAPRRVGDLAGRRDAAAAEFGVRGVDVLALDTSLLREAGVIRYQDPVRSLQLCSYQSLHLLRAAEIVPCRLADEHLHPTRVTAHLLRDGRHDPSVAAQAVSSVAEELGVSTVPDAADIYRTEPAEGSAA